MSDDNEIQLHVTYASHRDMDEAFCACMRIAIATGECADWCHHHAWNQEAQIRPRRALVAKLFVGQYGLLVGGNINDAAISLRLALQLERMPCLP